jgi:hypothetical protein
LVALGGVFNGAIGFAGGGAARRLDASDSMAFLNRDVSALRKLGEKAGRSFDSGSLPRACAQDDGAF